MYSNLPNLIIGFHGCDRSTYENVLYKHERLRASHNSYDWLGNGIYFWENSLDRAEEWAISYCKRYNKKNPDKEQKEPAVIGAVISLGHCLDLTDYGSTSILQTGYKILESKKFYQKNNSSIWIYGIFKLSHLRKIQTPRKELFHV